MKRLIVGFLMLVSCGVSANSGWTVREAMQFERSALIATEYYLMGYWAANSGACITEKKSMQISEEALLMVKYNAEGHEPFFAAIHWALMDVGGCMQKENPSE
ncbi:hypothetical protein NVP1123O_14 [Vibrio phage 1.123.O._10N.286.48.F3]|nr:hypothetical protein NVP1123O_14 [Vibrio phage 1.123.O._10N.286.48.F3]